MNQLLQLPASPTINHNRYYVAKEVTKCKKYTSNIFQEVLQEYRIDKGPKLTEKGEILKHTLVGKVEWYNKQRNSKKLMFEDTSNRILQMRAFIKTETDKTSGQKSDVKSIKMQSSGKSKKHVNLNLATKNQLLEELKQIKSRIDFNKKYEQNKIYLMDPQSQREFTKETRILSKHEDMENYWTYFTEKQACLLERDRSSSQLVKAEKYKIKNDAAVILDAYNKNYSNLKPKNWEQNLRDLNNTSYSNMNVSGKEIIVEKIKKTDFLAGPDLPRTISDPTFFGDKIQYVNKPGSIENVAYSSFNSSQYLQKRLQETTDFMNLSYMTQFHKRNDLDQLIINGKSQYEIEKQMIIGDKRDNATIYKKENETLQEEQIKEQVYEQNYKNKVRKDVVHQRIEVTIQE